MPILLDPSSRDFGENISNLAENIVKNVNDGLASFDDDQGAYEFALDKMGYTMPSDSDDRKTACEAIEEDIKWVIQQGYDALEQHAQDDDLADEAEDYRVGTVRVWAVESVLYTSF
jgi:hypothetical protein